MASIRPNTPAETRSSSSTPSGSRDQMRSPLYFTSGRYISTSRLRRSWFQIGLEGLPKLPDVFCCDRCCHAFLRDCRPIAGIRPGKADNAEARHRIGYHGLLLPADAVSLASRAARSAASLLRIDSPKCHSVRGQYASGTQIFVQPWSGTPSRRGTPQQARPSVLGILRPLNFPLIATACQRITCRRWSGVSAADSS